MGKRSYVMVAALLCAAACGVIFSVVPGSRGGRFEAQGPQAPHTAAPVIEMQTASAMAAQTALPLRFEPNLGQTDRRVRYISRGAGYTLFLTDEETVLALHSGLRAATVRMRLAGANSTRRPSPAGRAAGTSNYLTGRSSNHWTAGVPQYERIQYPGVYRGIDLLYYGNAGQLEYDFVVAPKAGPDQIRFDIQGAQRLRDASGELLIETSGGTVRLHKPVVYQEAHGRREPVEAQYILLAGNQVGFALGAYDRTRPLVIDPVLNYATYLGGGGSASANAVAVDKAGNIYVAGVTSSIDFPVPAAGSQGPRGNNDIFLTKLDSTGTKVLYSTYIGGSRDDSPAAIAVDHGGSVYMTGTTASTDFPTMRARIDVAGGGADAFLLRLDPSGASFVYSTYLGGRGSDEAKGLAIDPAGYAYVTGRTNSPDFPLANPLQAACGMATNGECSTDAFVTRVSPDGATFPYSTYLGGRGDDSANAIAVDGDGYAYIAGQTSGDFPLAHGTQPKCGGQGGWCSNAFVSKLATDGSALIYSTYLGGVGADYATAIAVDSQGRAYVTGRAGSYDFPVAQVTDSTCKVSAGSCHAAFVSALTAEGGLRLSRFIGGSGDDVATSIALDASATIYVAGRTSSPDFPTTSAVQPKCALDGSGQCSVDGFVAAVSSEKGDVLFSTFLGGRGTDQANAVAVSASGDVIVAGRTDSADFPTAHALQPEIHGPASAFVATISAPVPVAHRVGAAAVVSCTGDTFTSTQNSAWETPGNWSTGFVPTSADNVCIPSGIGVVISSNAAAASINAGASVTVNSGWSLTLGATASDFSAGFTLNGTLNIPSGATVTIGGTAPAFVWTAGTVQGVSGLGAGSISAAGIDFTGSAKTLNAVQLTNTGTGLIGSSGGYVYFYNSATLTNTATGVIDIDDDNGFYAADSTATAISNAGAINRKFSTNAAHIDVPLINTGSVNVYTGSLNIDNSATNTGTMTTQAAGATLNFTSSTFNQNAGGIISGPGAVSFTGATAKLNAGTYNVTGSTNTTSASVTFFSSSALTVTAVGALNISGGTTTFNNGTTIQPVSITMTGGTLSGSDPFLVGGVFNWTGGTITGIPTAPPPITAPTIHINGGGKTLDGRSLVVNGTGAVADMTDTNSYLSMANGATINNLAGATFNAVNNKFISSSGTPAPRFNNAGTFNRSSVDQGSFQVDTLFNNSGAVNVTQGSLNLSGGGSSGGTFAVGSTASINFDGTHTLSGSLNVQGAASWSGGNTTVTGSFSSAATTVNSANVTFTGTPLNLTTLTVNSGTTAFSTGAILTPGSVTLNGGNLGGSDTIAVTGAFTWNGGRLYGSVTPVPFTCGTFVWGGSNETLDSRKLTFTGAGSNANGNSNSYISMNNGAIFQVAPGATLSLSSSAALNFYSSNGSTVQNDGTFNLNTTSTMQIDGAFNNTGTVNVQAGILDLNGGGASTGSYHVSNAALHFANGHSLSGLIQSTAAGVGTVAFDAGSNSFTSGSQNAAYNISGATVMVSGTMNFAPGSVMTSVGTVNVNGGTLSFNSGSAITMTALNLSAGTLAGADPVNITGAFNWTGGTFGGASGSTLQVASANGGMALSGTSSKTLDHRIVTNNGTGQMTGQYLYLSNSAQITNPAGKTFTVTDAPHFYDSGSPGLFQNDGTFVLNGSSQDFVSDVPFNNTGTVNVQSRVLALNAGGTSTGTFNVASELDLANGHTITGTIAGAGTVAFNGGAVTIGGASGTRTYAVTGATVCTSGTVSFVGGTTVSSVGALTVTGGALNFSSGSTISPLSGALSGGTLTGSDPITFAGAFAWSGGTLSGVTGGQINSITTVNGALSLGAGAKTLDRRTLIGAGGTAVTGSTYVNFNNGALLQNPAGKTLSTSQDYNFYNGTGGGTFQNDGTMNVSSPNHFSFDIAFNNTGTVNAQTGVLQLDGGGTSAGAFNVATVLELSGTHTLTGTIAGAGTVHFIGSGNNVTNVGGASGTRIYNITGSTQVDGGTINFAPGETLTNVGAVGVGGGHLSFNSGAVVNPSTLTVTAGTLDGSDLISVTDVTHWTGGNIAGGSGATQAVLNAKGGLDLSGGGRFLYSRTLNNGGTAVMNSSYLYLDGSAIFNNQATGTFDLQAGNININSGSPAFNNAGTFTRSTTTTELSVSPTFVNTGTLDVKLGTLNLGNYGGGSSTGTMTVSSASSALKIYNMQVGGTVSGPGAVNFIGGGSTVTASYNVTGGTSVTGGSVLFGSGATPASIGPLSVSSGTCNFSTGLVVTTPSLNFASGTLTGADAINVTGPFTWVNGTLSGTGVVNAGGAVTLGGSSKVLDARPLNISGTASLTDSGSLYIGNGGVFRVTSTGTLNMQNTTGIYNNGGTGLNQVQNDGTLIRNASTGTTTIDVSFVNAGTVAVQTGVLHFGSTYTQTAGATNLAGGSLAIASNQLFDIQGGVLAGTGTITGSVKNAGTLSPGASTGTMAITGAYTQTAAGIMSIGIGGVSTGQYDVVSVGGVALLNGTLNIALLNSYLPAGGESFPIVSATSVSGTFASIVGNVVGNGVFFGVGYGATGVALNAAAANPTPVISYLAPASLPAGAVSFALQVNGYNFVNGSTVMWNGSARSTTYVSSTVLIAQISSADVASPATVPVTVYNPPPPTNGVTSAAANFNVLAINGNITIAGNNVAAGGSARVPITVNLGSNVSADSISFGLTVTPNAGAPAITTNLTFVNNPANSTYPVPRIDQPQPSQIAVSWLDPLNPVLSGSVYLGDVVVTLPSNATPTQTYTAQITGASASLGTTTQLTLGFGSPATLTVTGTYLVGDVYPFSGNTVGQFGNDTLENLDLVNALRAIANFAPYTAPSCSDRYDAMDANGDGAVDNLDLLVTLGRLSFPDQVRPRRGSRGLYCPASAIIAALSDDNIHVMKTIGPGGTAGVVVARLELGTPASSGGGLRVPVYLNANENINLMALTIGVRLAASSSAKQMQFVNGDLGGPTLLDTDLTRRMAASWLHGGVQAAAGQRLLIGYINLPGGALSDVPKLQFSAVQGHDAATGQGVLINVPIPAAGQQQ